MVSGTERPNKIREADDFIAAARQLRERGYGIVWLRPGEKRPTREGWTLASQEPSEYTLGSNLGILTGRISGDLVCVDLDSAQALDAADDYLPPTRMIDGRLGKPRSHRWYQVVEIPRELASRAAGGIGGPWLKRFPGIDFLGTGGQAAVPPSRHASGEERIWHEFDRPATVPMRELWDAVLALATSCGWERPTAPPRVASNHVDRKANATVVDRARKYLAKIPGAVSGQRGHDRTFHAACVLTQGFALSAEEAYPLLAEWNLKCEPPWREKDLWHKLADAAAKPAPRGHLLESALAATRRDMPTSNGHAAHQEGEEDTAKPIISVSRASLKQVTSAAWAALQAGNNPPRLFRYGGVPSRIEQDDDGAPIVRSLNKDRMRHELARVAAWAGCKEEPVFPPGEVAADVLASPNPQLPVLTRIVECPVFAPDGSLHSAPGYSHGTRAYFAPAAGFTVPEAPIKPTAREIEDAVELLAVELLGEFPFIGEAERAHALAALLLPFVRDMIPGPTPLHSVEAPQPGTGKTLLADIITFPAVGRPVSMMTEASDEDEWRKRLLAKLRSGPTIVIIDNVRRRIDSGSLAAAITAYPILEDRVLGQSEIVRVPVRCLWLLTANNPALSNELARRTIRCRLDAKVDQPWLRTGFRHPDLRGWARENRGRIVRAALTIIQAWIAAGRPDGEKTLGAFETWARVMGGILDVAGVRGFLDNLQDFYENVDPETASWQGFIATWWENQKGNSCKAHELWPLAVECGLSLGRGNEQSQKTRLGLMLRGVRDRVFSVRVPGGPDRLRVEAVGDDHRARLWRLRQC